jgi:hypothetical protein
MMVQADDALANRENWPSWGNELDRDISTDTSSLR